MSHAAASRAKEAKGPLLSRRIVDGLDDRLGAAPALRRLLRKAFPGHWSFLLGELALYTFVLLVVTGIFLALFFEASAERVVYNGPYEPLRGQSVSVAFASVMRLSYEVRSGLVIRQVHHWAALVFVAVVSLHCLRVFFTGAFRKPREPNWLIGIGLLAAAMAAGFTGYSLPDDLLSGTGLRIAYSVLISIPLVGVPLGYLIFGGPFPSAETIPRFQVAHILVIPAVIAGLLALHLALVLRQRHTQHRGPGRAEGNVVGVPVWPQFAVKSIGLGLVVWAVITLLAAVFQVNPVWLYGPYDPTQVASPAQPDWYLGWLEGSLRLWPNWSLTLGGYTIAEPFVPGVVLPAVFFGVLVAWPRIERWKTGDRDVHHLLDRPRDAPWRSCVGAAGLAYVGVLTLAGGSDVLADFSGIPIEALTWVLRGLVIGLPVMVGFLTYWTCRRLGRAAAAGATPAPGGVAG